MRARWLVGFAVAWLAAGRVGVAAAADGVEVPLAERQLAWSVPSGVLDDLRTGNWSHAVDGLLKLRPGAMSSAEAADYAFVTSWAMVRCDRAQDALRFLEPMQFAGTVPMGYRDLVSAEVLRAAGRRGEALERVQAAAATPALAARAAVVGSQILREMGRTADASALLEAVASRRDPVPDGNVVLWAVAERHGLGSEAAYPWVRRVWASYPRSAEGKLAQGVLAERYPTMSPSLSDQVSRASALGAAGAWGDVLALVGPLAEAGLSTTADGCRLTYERVRALYKRNELSAAVTAMGPHGAACKDLPGDEGAKLLYLAGEALFRRGSYQDAAMTYASIAQHHPASSMVDDGLTRSGIAWWEAADKDKAATMWLRALDERPEGDTTPEAAFRLAFAHYDQGRPAQAVEVAERLSRLNPRLDEVHVPAGAYWAARWKLYPTAASPSQAVADGAARAAALQEWEALVQARPRGWYAMLAWSRLAELAPERAKALAELRSDAPEPVSWNVPEAFYADPAVQDGVALARVGLVREALVVWSDVDLDAASPDAVAWLTELRVVAGDWLEAHARMHRWLRTHPLSTLGENERAIVRLAYPDRYGAEVRAAAAPFAWPWRAFHALTREESLFNVRVVSHAGAKGLAQLMPGTATEVAKSLGIPTGDLFDPAVNARLGATYLDTMIRRYRGVLPLAFAAYNAGPGRVDQWLTERGALPLDEWVERIPFRETRGYVKRVSSTWQVLQHDLAGDEPRFVDLSRANHTVKP